MAYGYVKGAEEAAVAYYEALIAQTVDPQERGKIKAIMDDLREAIRTKERPQPEWTHGNETSSAANFASSNISGN
jgi:hypothetical protein